MMKIYRSRPKEPNISSYSKRLDEFEIDLLMDLPSDCFRENEDGTLTKVSKEELANTIRTRIAACTAYT